MAVNQDSLSFRTLQKIEAFGNRLPDPAWLFVWLCGLILVLSLACYALGVSAIHPVTQESLHAKNLISGDGIRWILANTVTNFTGFAPVGTVLVAIMGIGVAEHSGLLSAVLRQIVLKAPERVLTFIVVLAGVLSSLAADAGYVVLIPLAAMVFVAAGRPPLAGIAAAFAGVSGGFSANLMIGPVDAILAGISTEAAGLIASGYEVSAAANYYFIVVSTLLIAVLGTWVTERLVLPRLSGDVPERDAAQESDTLSAVELRALKITGWFSLVFFGLIALGILPQSGVLRDPETHSILRSPFIGGIVTLIALYAALAGVVYGKVAGVIKSHRDIIAGMEKSMATMASYLVLMFFAAQFVNYFAWTDLGAIFAIKGAQALQTLGLGTTITMLAFILLAACLNLLIGSASAKWALLAPVFVPMFYLLGISPEATQVAYRVGDSVTNIITPLMPYFGVVVAFAQRYDRNTGIGSIMATMLPYSVVFLIGWSILLAAWIGLGLPFGPGAYASLVL
ncbi:MAG: AbgT family transporter [bacterium]